MKKIELTQGEFALVDDEDFEWLNQYTWRCQKRYSPSGRILKYAVRQVRISNPTKNSSGRRVFFAMHRQILKLVKEDKRQTDHIDCNGLNNQKYNLRICSTSQNLQNQRRSMSKTSSKYKGVYKCGNRWQALINSNGKKYYLGCFKNELDAAEAYDFAALKYHGEFARLNFDNESRGQSEGLASQ